MKPQNSSQRDVLAHAVVVGGVFFGCASFFIAPAMQKRADTRAELVAVSSQLSESEALSKRSDALLSTLNNAQQYEQAILDRSAAASDELSLYEAYRSISSDLGIEIVRFDPRSIASTVPTRSRRGEESKAVSPEFAASVRIDASGPLPAIIELIDRISTEAGFVRVRSARITPNDEVGDDGVTLSLECEHYGFRVPDPSELFTEDAADGEGA